jgi:hypothetical protein
MTVNADSIFPQTLEKAVGEETTPRLTFLVVDDTGAAIPGPNLDLAELTVYDERTGTVLTANAPRDIQAQIDGSGNGSVSLTDVETAINDDTLIQEWHIAYFHWEYNGNADDGKAAIRFKTWNLAKVP